MLITRYKNDTYPLVIDVSINGQAVDFSSIDSMDLKFKVDGVVKSINTTDFSSVDSTVTFDVASNPTIFDEVGVFDASLVANEVGGFVRTYAVGKLVIEAIVE